MGRRHSFYDDVFNTANYDASDGGSFEKGLVFAAMPFDGAMDEAWGVIQGACHALGLRPTRVDEGVGAGFIVKEIASLIERAEFIIFDLTMERPNVYYELGYAHGVGNEAEDILLVAATGTQIHFDVSAVRVQFYSSSENLRAIVSESLTRMLATTRPRNPSF